MAHHPLSNERLAQLVRALAASDGAKQREGLAGVRLRSTRARVKREGTPGVQAAPAVADRDAKIRAQLGGDIVGRIVPFVISTAERAQDGHTIAVDGWETDDYERAPHVFWAHETSGWRASPSRAAARIGASVVEKTPDALMASCGFYTRDFSNALDGGFSYAIGEISALQGHRASVGFDIVEASLASEEVRRVIPQALDIAVARLDEWSILNFGSDDYAISAGREAGIDVEPIARALERFLDDVAGCTGLARAELARMWGVAADPGRPTIHVGASLPAAAAYDPEAVRAAVRAALTPL